MRSDIQPNIKQGDVYYWAYEIPKPILSPLKISLEYVKIHQSDTFQFQIDTGSDPQPGQKWQLNQPIELGGFSYVIDQVEMLENGYNVRWHSGFDVPEGASFTLSIDNLLPSPEIGTQGMEDRSGDRVDYAHNFITDEPMPNGTLTFELTLHQITRLPGPWTLTWTPPGQ